MLELAQDFRGSLISETTADKITMRILGKQSFPAATHAALSPKEIRSLRGNLSQAVFARVLNVTTGYVSKLESGAKRPTGAALALLSVIKRKGLEAIL
ncbi:helix-turn-helix domain-containing protein [Bradyrhizobium sp.]|uniref:helix-turn-helix domain-containing protein n=1 Tax=Bradyrhizobium sp. TaxID=376 RepID=UPI003C4D3B98